MRSFRTSLLLAASVAAGSSVPTVLAQQVTGTLGSPSATISVDGRQLPAPTPAFGGVIKQEALQSTPWWAPRIVPPKGAPQRAAASSPTTPASACRAPSAA